MNFSFQRSGTNTKLYSGAMMLSAGQLSLVLVTVFMLSCAGGNSEFFVIYFIIHVSLSSFTLCKTSAVLRIEICQSHVGADRAGSFSFNTKF